MDNQQEIENKIKNSPNRKGFISKQQLEQLYLIDKLSDQEIGKLYNMSLGQVHRLRNKYNIKSLEQYQRHRKQELDQKEKEFLIGVMLGDGHIRWRQGKKTNPELMLEQSVDHKDYILWLKDQIKDWMFDPNKALRQARKINKKTGKVHHSYPVQTICHPVFAEFHQAFYNKNIKMLDIEFIKQYFTDYSFAIWIMDDATISKNRNIVICSHSFTKKENEILSNFIKEKYSISSKVLINKHTEELTYYLSFNKENSLKITNLLKDLIIPSMQYKLISPETTK